LARFYAVGHSSHYFGENTYFSGIGICFSQNKTVQHELIVDISEETMYTPPLQQKHGYTLLEILVVILIISLLTTLAIPNFVAWLHRYRLQAAAASIMNHLRAARLLAIFKGYKHEVQIRASGDGNYYQVAEYPPDTEDQVIMSIGRVVLHERFGEVRFVSIPRYGKITFNPKGTSTPCSMTLENSEKKQIKITINSFGRIKSEYL
jgi:type IV fimbrial biogenesis protein FimT